MDKYVYLDNAATSLLKPESVYDAVNNAMRECGNPGRSGHKHATSSGKIIGEARMLCARLFNAPTPESIIFTYNATVAINMAIKGFIKPGDHVITSNMEHNSVSRPLHQLGQPTTKIEMDLSELKKAVRPDTKLVVCSHISNVTGAVNDIESIGKFCKENEITFLVDAAQSAGSIPINVEYIDMLAFPGHKGLLGPQGTGGLYLRPGLKLKTLVEGGTGSASESLQQPESYPDKLESGTPNTPGLAGLAAGVRFVIENFDDIIKKENELMNRLVDGIAEIKGIKLVGGYHGSSVASFVFNNIAPAEAAIMLDAGFGIAVRSGLHCAADAHETLGTLKSGGTLRISPNFFNTVEDIDYCLMALGNIS